MTSQAVEVHFCVIQIELVSDALTLLYIFFRLNQLWMLTHWKHYILRDERSVKWRLGWFDVCNKQSAWAPRTLSEKINKYFTLLKDKAARLSFAQLLRINNPINFCEREKCERMSIKFELKIALSFYLFYRCNKNCIYDMNLLLAALGSLSIVIIKRHTLS